MVDAKYDWKLKQFDFDQAQVQAIAKEMDLSPLIVQILFERGYQTSAAIRAFLNPSPEGLADPFLMHDMQRGIDRISQAIENDEQISVYGDYDADGLTSTAIMYEALSEVGARVNYYVPNRFTDGYGPNQAAFEKLIQAGTTLIVTVDNGVSGNEAVDFANQNGCDVIITDHHEIPAQGLPDAYAIIHARYPGDEYPFGDFSGAGIAFKVTQALLDEIPQDCLDLVTIGTVADLVPLTGENRILAKFGFTAIQNTLRPGLLALLDNAKLSGKPIDGHQIGFGIAPRLNALGRMGDANVGVELLTTVDESAAKQFADQTEALNVERRRLVNTIYKEAVEQADNPANQAKQTLIVSGAGWHEGVVGIVASRLVDRYHKPTVVLNIDEKTQTAKGSGRSIPGFDLFAALEPARDKMVKFGGHAMAVGLTVAANQIPAVANQLEAGFEVPAESASEKPPLLVDAKVAVDQIDMPFYESLAKLAPVGNANPQPVFEVLADNVSNPQTMGAKHNHLRMVLNGQHAHLTAVAFSRADCLQSIQSMPTGVEVVGSIELNSWQNRTSLQLMVSDIQTQGLEIVDRRTSQLSTAMFSQPGTYVFFDRKLMDKLRSYIGEKSRIVWYNDLADSKLSGDVFLVDFPTHLADLATVLESATAHAVILYLFKAHRVSDSGLPNRQQFSQLFRLLSGTSQLKINQALDTIAERMQTNRALVIFMVRVFAELNLITIQDGVLTVNPNPTKQDLLSADSYQHRQNQLALEQQLLLANSTALTTLLSGLVERDEGE